MSTTKGIVGIFPTPEGLLESGTQLRARGIAGMDAFTPFPIHGIDHAIGIKRSWVSAITLIFGLLGFAFGIWMQWWTSAVDWPINVGGKPLASWPAFVPIIFECTVLFAGVATFFGVIGLCGLPRGDNGIVDPRVSNDSYALWVPTKPGAPAGVEIEQVLKSNGAIEVRSV